MGQPQIILTLGDVIGKLVANGKSETARSFIASNEVDSDQLRFLTSIESKSRYPDRRVRCNHRTAITLVEPLRLHAYAAWQRLAALQAEPEHSHRICEWLLMRSSMHRITCVRTTQVRQTSARHQAVRRVRMRDRRQQAILVH